MGMMSYPENPVCGLQLPKVMGTLVYFQFLSISWLFRSINGYERVEQVLTPVLY